MRNTDLLLLVHLKALWTFLHVPASPDLQQGLGAAREAQGMTNNQFFLEQEGNHSFHSCFVPGEVLAPHLKLHLECSYEALKVLWGIMQH